MIPRKIDNYLRQHTSSIKHSGRSLYDHLKGTYEILEKAEALEHVCLAGLFHSIYGTNIFHFRAVSNRNEVSKVIGVRAERLAYIFCSCNRPRELIDASQGEVYTVVDRHNGAIIILSPRDLYDLLTIEMANLVEQNSLQLLPQIIEALKRVGDEMLSDMRSSVPSEASG